VDFQDIVTNNQNAWVYETDSLPILFIDYINKPIANINVSAYSWNNLSYELNNLRLTSNITFSIEDADELNPIKEKYYYISNSSTPLTSTEISQIPVDMVVNGNGNDVLIKSKIENIEPTAELPKETVVKQDLRVTNSRSAIASYKTQSNYSNNVIPINSKYAEVLMLSEEGLSEIEIAKKLGMGKGEVELVLGMNK
jgi:hypothetical protein